MDKCHTNIHLTCVLAWSTFPHSSQWLVLLHDNNRSSDFCVYLPGRVQFHGLLTKLDVLFPWWSQAKATRSALKDFSSLRRAVHRCHAVTEQHVITNMWWCQNKHTLPTLLFSLCTLSHPPPLFSPEPADRFDVLPARRPHRLLGGLSKESQGTWRTRQGAVGYLCGPGEEVPSSPQRRPITQVPLQKWWAVIVQYSKEH